MSNTKRMHLSDDVQKLCDIKLNTSLCGNEKIRLKDNRYLDVKMETRGGWSSGPRCDGFGCLLQKLVLKFCVRRSTYEVTYNNSSSLIGQRIVVFVRVLLSRVTNVRDNRCTLLRHT